ncbi:hypothetical protein ACFU8W_24625 [Streptomyces sp. NPDC057565]
MTDDQTGEAEGMPEGQVRAAVASDTLPGRVAVANGRRIAR